MIENFPVSLAYFVRRETWPGWKIEPRTIPNHELVLVLSGRGEARIKGRIHPLGTGSFLYFRPGLLHDMKTDDSDCLVSMPSISIPIPPSRSSPTASGFRTAAGSWNCSVPLTPSTDAESICAGGRRICCCSPFFWRFIWNSTGPPPTITPSCGCAGPSPAYMTIPHGTSAWMNFSGRAAWENPPFSGLSSAHRHLSRPLCGQGAA